MVIVLKKLICIAKSNYIKRFLRVIIAYFFGNNYNYK